MSFDVKDFKELFTSKFYIPAFIEWRINKKSGKDIVGHYYENFINELYLINGLPIFDKKRKILGTEYNADTVVGKSIKKIISVAEDKGHYLDKTFFKRALSNATDLYFECLENNITPPFFVLNCPTTYNRYVVIYNKEMRKYSDEMVNVIKEKLKYFPVCKHDRIPAKDYFMTMENCFKFDDGLIESKLNFINELKNGL
jgi:hypothetical protein